MIHFQRPVGKGFCANGDSGTGIFSIIKVYLWCKPIESFYEQNQLDTVVRAKEGRSRDYTKEANEDQ